MILTFNLGQEPLAESMARYTKPLWQTLVSLLGIMLGLKIQKQKQKEKKKTCNEHSTNIAIDFFPQGIVEHKKGKEGLDYSIL